jgi:hypothetical protein
MSRVSDWRHPGSLAPEIFRSSPQDADIIESATRRIVCGEIDPVAEVATLPYVKISPNE